MKLLKIAAFAAVVFFVFFAAMKWEDSNNGKVQQKICQALANQYERKFAAISQCEQNTGNCMVTVDQYEQIADLNYRLSTQCPLKVDNAAIP